MRGSVGDPMKCPAPWLACRAAYPEHVLAAAGDVEMFLNEARLAAQLSHPNIVQLFELGEWSSSTV